METRTDGGYSGGQGVQNKRRPDLAGPSDFGSVGGVATLARDARAASTRSLRVVIGPPPLTGRDALLPGQRAATDPMAVTAELPRITEDLRKVRRSNALPRARAKAAERRAAGVRAAPAAPARAASAAAKRGPVQPGMFLLPLRVFLGLAFLLEGLRKFYDPGFLDADAPDSFAHHIQALHDGSWFPPVMDLAADHAITTGLLFAFGQVLVGVGALLGLWTRLMGLIGMLLALGVLIAVGGNSSPYHGAYVVFLAAWSPLALAGAPMYSVDCWLSLRKWRGPLTTPVRARRRKLGYGSIIAGLAVGTTLLAGALFGHPARDGSAPGADETTVTGPPAVRTSTGPAGQAPAAPPAASAPPSASSTASVTAKPSAGAGSSGSAAPKASASTQQKTPAEGTTTRKPAAGGGNAAPTAPNSPRSVAEKPSDTKTMGGSAPLGGLLGG